MSKYWVKKEKKMTTAEACNFHKTFTLIFLAGGVMMILVGTAGAVKLYGDLWQGITWWFIGIMFIGVGIQELRQYRFTKKKMQQEKSVPHDEKI
jgi:hypothetical protein